ncbi:MAG: RNA polymerase sigma factor [Rhizobiaceae bacterium]|nr:RNA polymerase sigma factor [Rhizobiaceae bacterium]
MVEQFQNNEALARQRIELLVREEWGKLLSCLIAYLGDFQLAEDALQDALESALQHWKRNGLPRSPAAWVLQTARRKAIDRLRRAANFKSKQSEYQLLLEMDRDEMEGEEMHEIGDERLRLIFTCCHPALDRKSSTALTLRTLGGLQTGEIARAFLDSEKAMAQRLVRAKRKIRAAAIPYVVPDAHQWGERLNGVLSVIYLIFNEGYFSGHGEAQIRTELSNEAIRLTKTLMELKPAEPEIEGLLALMLLHDSRREARQNAQGEMVSIEEQDRSLWDKSKIKQGLGILDEALRKLRPGPYQIQAAISATHARAASHSTTGWDEIVLLYDELFKVTPSPVVALNKSVAVSFSQSPKAALKLLGELEDALKNYQPFYASKADFHRRNGDITQARSAYLKAMELCNEENTRAFLQRRMDKLK